MSNYEGELEAEEETKWKIVTEVRSRMEQWHHFGKNAKVYPCNLHDICTPALSQLHRSQRQVLQHLSSFASPSYTANTHTYTLLGGTMTTEL